MMELNGIPLSPQSARLLFLPISHLMKRTLLACPLEEVPEFYRAEYATQVIRGPLWQPRDYGIAMVHRREPSIYNADVAA